jgi:hypothetical protein
MDNSTTHSNIAARVQVNGGEHLANNLITLNE